ncbi:MAG TPA: hypothetical protein VM680_16080 [Verrucomicrobiae bacterium]|nr:hypothetical protein [Verrucomicrobiae bacterium]
MSTVALSQTVRSNDSVLFQFDSVPEIQLSPGEGGQMKIWLKEDLFGPGDSVRIDLLETAPEWQPRSFLFNYRPEDFYGTGTTEMSSFNFGMTPSPWPDLKGAVQLSVLSGSVNVDRLEIRMDMNYSSSHYGEFYAVPEPTINSLALWCGAVFLLYKSFFRASVSRP